MAKRVMVVDDALFIRVNLKMLLTKWGYEIVGEAGDGEAAVQLFQTVQPDIVLLDVTMPKMNGLDALKEMRKINPDAAFIIVSAMGNEHTVVEAAQIGINDFVVKPIVESKLKEALENVE